MTNPVLTRDPGRSLMATLIRELKRSWKRKLNLNLKRLKRFLMMKREVAQEMMLTIIR